MHNKILRIASNALIIILMVGLIPIVTDDYTLAALYTIIIIVALTYRRYPGDIPVLILGVVTMTFFEYIFLLTGVETFHRITLLDVMPIWLPILWGFGFVAMKRAVITLGWHK